MIFSLRQLIFPVVLLLITHSAHAVNVNYSLEGGVGYSDNIRRVGTDPQNDVIQFVGGTLSVVDESSTNDFVLDVDLAYFDYRDDSFEDDVIADIALASNFSLVDDALTWTVDGNYGQQAINPFVVTTPNNLQDTGFLSTGPNFVLQFTSVDSLTLGYRYVDFYAELVSSDYNSNLFSAVLARRLSRLHTLSVDVGYNDLTYDDVNNSDFTDLRYSLVFSGDSRTTQYRIEWGVIDIEFEDGESLENDLKRFSISRQMNSSNAIALQLSETIDNGARAVNIANPGFVTGNLFVNNQAQVTYTFDRGELIVALRSLYSDQDFSNQDTLDQKMTNNSIDISYGTPNSLQTTLGYRRLARDFYRSGQVDVNETISLRLERRLTSSFNIAGTFINFVRKSNIQTQDIEENRVIVTLRYLGRF